MKYFNVCKIEDSGKLLVNGMSSVNCKTELEEVGIMEVLLLICGNKGVDKFELPVFKDERGIRYVAEKDLPKIFFEEVE